MKLYKQMKTTALIFSTLILAQGVLSSSIQALTVIDSDNNRAEYITQSQNAADTYYRLGDIKAGIKDFVTTQGGNEIMRVSSDFTTLFGNN